MPYQTLLDPLRAFGSGSGQKLIIKVTTRP